MESNKKSEKRQRNPGLPGKTGLARALYSSFQNSWPSTRQVLSPALSVLIANLELEFHVSPLRITDLKFSNRKFFTIFCPGTRRVSHESRRAPPNRHEPLLPRVTRRGPRAAGISSSIQPLVSSFQNLIETPRLEFRPTTTNHVSSKFLIETKTGLCISDSRRVTARAFPCVFH